MSLVSARRLVGTALFPRSTGTVSLPFSFPRHGTNLSHASSMNELPAADPAELGFDAAALNRVPARLQQFVDRGQIAGGLVLVARHGRVALRAAVGWRDLETREPLATDALFRIYSMTKPVTCAGALLLAEQGELDLDAPIERWLPELADRQVWRETGWVAARRSITPRDLLRHTAGLTYGPYGNTPVDQMYTRARLLAPDQTLADLLVKLQSLPLISHPGEQFQYGVATDVLGRLIEVIARRPLDQFLHEELFAPLGMSDTGFWVAEEKLSRLVTKYSFAEGVGLRPLERAEQSTLSQPPQLVLGGAGLVSTLDDYARFCQMLLSGGRWGERRVLRGETVAHMTANQLVGSAYPVKVTTTPWAGVGYGLGVSVVCERLSADSGVPVGEYGWSGSASTHFWNSPRDDLFVIVLAQVIPFSLQLEWALKPLVYQALRDRGPVTGPSLA